jgi:hypothetical protein
MSAGIRRRDRRPAGPRWTPDGDGGRLTLVRVRPRGIVSLLAAGAAGVAAAVALGSAGGSTSPAGAATTAQTVTLGNATTGPSSSFTNICVAGSNCTYLPFSGVSQPGLQVPFDGTVRSFSVNSGSSGNQVELRVLRPAGGGKFTGAGTSPPEKLPGGPATFTVSLPVKAGDILGLDNSDSALIFESGDPNAITAYYELPSLAEGATAAPNRTATGDRLLLSAVVVQTITTGTTGTTTTGTTIVPPMLKVTPTSAQAGPVAPLALTCTGSTGQSCAGAIVGTVREKKKAGKVIGVTAQAEATSARKTKAQQIAVTVARVSYSVPTGATQALQVGLNARGQKLLRQFHRLSVRLAFSGTLTTTITAAFAQSRPNEPRIQVGTPPDRWFHINLPCGDCYTMAQKVPITGIPKAAHVTVICGGAGCPLGRRSVTPHHGRINVASLLGTSHLEPRTKVQVVISAPRTKAETIVYTMQRGAGPVRTTR